MWSERPIAGSAGTIASIASALIAISPAIKATNSRKPGRIGVASASRTGGFRISGLFTGLTACGGMRLLAAAAVPYPRRRAYERRRDDPCPPSREQPLAAHPLAARGARPAL